MNTRTIAILAVVAVLLLAMGKSVIASLWQLLIFVAWIFGVVRSWQAHWVLGVVALIVAPVGVIVGVVSLLTGRNFGDEIVGWFRR